MNQHSSPKPFLVRAVFFLAILAVGLSAFCFWCNPAEAKWISLACVLVLGVGLCILGEVLRPGCALRVVNALGALLSQFRRR
jgi:VanZ family protein